MSNTKTVMSQAANTQGLPLDITDVFSTYLYTGNGSARSITNGIDLDGEGGLVWIKGRDAARSHQLLNTEVGLSGTGSRLKSDSTAVSSNDTATSMSSFNSDGFSINYATDFNANGEGFASWTFRKAPKFFDVVTWTGDNSADRQIAHNLGQKPGMIIIKSTDLTRDWQVYHRSLNTTSGEYLELNQTAAVQTTTNIFNSTEPTDTHFTVGSNITVNGDTYGYVAYLFAHNDGDGEFGPDGDQDIIKCGSYTGTSATQDIDLGFETQWLLIKRTSSTGDWYLYDTMRGLSVGGSHNRLSANSSSQEFSLTAGPHPTSTGFQLHSSSNINTSGSDYIYIAIRRGPLAPPESATEVFNVSTRNASEPAYTSGFPVDFAFARAKSIANNWDTGSRLQQGNRMFTNLTNAEASNSNMMFDYQEGWSAGTGASTDYLSWMWKRAPNYFDVVAYTGTGSSSARAVSHNLGVDPEMMWVKRRDADIGTGWAVYHKGLDASAPQDYHLTINNATDRTNSFYRWGDTAPTATDFYIVEDMDASGGTFIACLFATLPGVSKVGSYTGNGSSQTIGCGFTSGARFILIKKAIGGIGNWYIFDSVRGIIAGNDPNLRLDNTGAEQALADIVDPHNSGFIVNSAGGLNASGSTYIFYAIA